MFANAWLNRICFAPDDAGAGGGGDGGAAGGGTALDPKEITSLRESIGELSKGINALMELGRQNQQQRQQREQQVEEEVIEEEDELDTLTESQLEALPRARFGQLLTGKIGKLIEGQLKPLAEQINGVTVATTTERVKTEVANLAAQHKDYWDFQQEMLVLAREHPTLSPTRLYRLARTEHPQKAAEMDKKYKGEADGEDDDGKQRRKINFGGMAPNGAGRDNDKARRMAPRDAANAAWDATIEALGGEPDFGDT